jgi:hypothetical protein
MRETGFELALNQAVGESLLYGLFSSPSEAPSAARAAEVNGTLRIGDKLYDVENGQLYSFGHKAAGSSTNAPVGELRSDYTVRLNDEKPVALASQKNVLFQFTIADNPEIHRLFSVEPDTGKSGKANGGRLVDAKQLLVAAANSELDAAKAQGKYLREIPMLTSWIAESNWFGMGNRSSSIKSLQDNLETQSKLLKGDLDRAFSQGLVEGKLDGEKLSGFVRATQKLAGSLASTSTDAVELASEGIRIQKQINESTYIAALTLAAAPAGAWVAGAASVGRTAIGLRALATMYGGAELSALFRATPGDDREQVMRNKLSGALESGLFVAGGIGARAIKDASTAAKAFFCLSDTAVQTLGFAVAARSRGDKDALSWQNLTIGGAAMLAGNLIGRASTPILRTQLSRFTKDAELIKRLLHSSESTISAITYGGSTAVFSYGESERERLAAQKGVKPEELSTAEVVKNMNWRGLPGYMADSAALSALPVAMVSPLTYRFSGHAGSRISERLEQFVPSGREKGMVDLGVSVLSRDRVKSGLTERLALMKSSSTKVHATRAEPETAALNSDQSVAVPSGQRQPNDQVDAAQNIALPTVVQDSTLVEPAPLPLEHPPERMPESADSNTELTAVSTQEAGQSLDRSTLPVEKTAAELAQERIESTEHPAELKEATLAKSDALTGHTRLPESAEREQQSLKSGRRGAGNAFEEKGDLRGYIGLLKNFDAQHADLLHTLLVMVQERDAASGKANPFRLLDGFKPKEFMEALKYLRGGETALPSKEEMRSFVQANDSVEAALKLTLTFGKAWPQWMRQMNAAGNNNHDATYWLPLRTVEQGRGLSEWLLRHTQSGQDELRLAARRWHTLTAEERQLSCGSLVRRIRSEQYGQIRDGDFAAECSRWGLEPERYVYLESRYLASAEVPSPLPLDRGWSEGELRGRFISRKDPRGLFLGEHTDCCQHPDGAGSDCAYYGQESVNSGFFVVEDRKGKIVAQSWAWVSDNGGLCFDNVEGKILGSRKEMVAAIYRKAGQDLTSMFHTVTLGTKCSDIDVSGWQMAGLKSLKPPRDFGGYRDSESQVVLGENLDRVRVRHDAKALKAYQDEMRPDIDTFQRSNRLSAEKLQNILRATTAVRNTDIETALSTAKTEKRQALQEYQAAKDQAETVLRETRQRIAAERELRESTTFDRIYNQAKESLLLAAKEARQLAEKRANESFESATKPAREAYEAAIKLAKETRDESTKSASGRPNGISREARMAYGEAFLRAEREFKLATDPAKEIRDAALTEAQSVYESAEAGIDDAVSQYCDRAFDAAIADVAPWAKGEYEAADGVYKNSLKLAEDRYDARKTAVEDRYKVEIVKAKQSAPIVRKQAKSTYRAEMLQAYRVLESARKAKKSAYCEPSRFAVDESLDAQKN